MSGDNSIPNGWVEITLGEVVDSANTGLDAIKRAPIVQEETGIKCFRIQDASQKKKYNKWGNTKVEDKNYQKFRLVKGDILIARTGNSIGVNHLVKKDIKSVFNNGLIRLRVNDKCNYTFLYKIIESRLFDRYVQSIAYGTSTQPNMQINVLLGFVLLLPPIPEQVAIAKILTAFDDKIELLQAQNKTLETTAQTLFKEWFGKYQIGDALPEGWRVGKITELFEVRDGTHDSPKQTEKGKLLITSKHLTTNRLKFEDAYLISNNDFIKINKRSAVHQYDILFSMIGTIGLTYFEQNKDINYAIKNVALFKTSENKQWANYTYLWLTSFLGKHFVSTNKSGTTQEYVSLTSLRNIEFIIPIKDIIIKFDTLTKPIFYKVYNNTTQIQTLKQTRDTLLPKLMSGQLRVDEFKEGSLC